MRAYHIVNMATGESLQYELTERAAINACLDANLHEIRNGRPVVYEVLERDINWRKDVDR